MAEVPVEVKKAPPAQTNVPDVWQSFRSEMDRLFDRFSGGFGFPSLRRMLDIEPAWRSSFSVSMPTIDMSEDDKAYKIHLGHRDDRPRRCSNAARHQANQARTGAP